MAANFRKTGLALLLAGMGGIYSAHAGLGPIRVMSADGESFSAEIPVVNENIEDLAQVNLADRNDFPLLSPYSGSAPVLHFSLVRTSDGHISKVLVKGPSSFGEPLLRFAVEVRWPAGSLVREFEVDYKRDGPRRKDPPPAGGDDGKRHAATPDQGTRLDGAGLGDIRVSSRLGERLAAELPLLGGAFDKSEQLRVSILPDPSQGAAMKEQLSLVASITHQLDRSTDGRRMLLLSSSQPITQARLSFRVEVVAGNVRAQKTYSLALDGAAAQGTEQARAAVKPEPKSAPRKAAEHALDGKVYHVNKGDTLSAIAMRVRGHARGEDVAGRLLRDNPDAFIRGDANRLLAGAELRYPASWAMRDAVDREEGGRPEVAAKPGSMAKLLAEGHQADQAKSASSQTEAHPEAKPAAAPAVKPEAKPVAKPAPEAKPAVKAASSPAALAAERRMRELLMKQDQALKQTEQRAKALEEQIRALQQTKSKPEADEAPASPTARKQEADASAKPAPAEPKPAIAKPEAPAAKREEHPSPPVESRPAASAPHAPPQLAQPVERKPEPAAQAKPQAERGMAAEAMAALSDRDVLIKLGGAAAALGLVALLLMRRRRAAAEGGESAGHADGGDQSATMQLKPLTSLMSSLKKGEGIDLDSVDVMAEVEVYLAYGRQDQALLILREGLDKEPQRQDLRYKLLEVLASQSDKAAFIEEAATAKRMFGKDSTMWQRVCELGRAAAPDHPLFEREAGAEPPSASLTAAAPGPRPAVSAPPPEPAAAPAPPPPAPQAAAPQSPISQAPAAASAVVEEDAEKMELAKLYMEMGDKETAELLMREAQHGR
ncbi:type IV pilus assembly protein FimV [Chromobacterium violaceum]|uniref:type IV pilus assembly protein FimV n=1 Tax=Chromobacterium violaceum TaxID=536 RepID=UPI0015FA3B23|nr:hypothetical protein [Chromobacterium violaceum]MBA8736423.1 hypothetical protein [Chromobacterium violaceum]